MHTLIAAIVYAETKEDAETEAKEVFDQLCTNDNYFDWHDSPERRWGIQPDALPIYSQESKELIKRLLGYTKQSFCESVENIRKILAAYDTKKLYRARDENPEGHFRYLCSCVGEDIGPHIRLYNPDGGGIREPKHLGYVLRKWDCLDGYKGDKNPYKNLSIWLVPRDIHY